MTYDFSTRLDHVGNRMPELNDNSIVYVRSTHAVVINNVTLSKINVNEENRFGITLLTQKMISFVFEASALQALDPDVPQIGDTITFDGNDYEVMSIGDQVFDYTTSSKKRIRVHAKQVA